VVGSRFPFRDPNRREDLPGNRPDRSRDDMAGNRLDAPPGNRADRSRDDMAGNRQDRSRDEVSGNRLDRPRDQSATNRRRPERPREEVAEPAPAVAPGVDLSTLTAEVETLIRLMTSTDVNELQIESGGLKLLIRRGHGNAPAAAQAPVLMVPPALPSAAPAPAEAPAAPAKPAAAAAPPAAPLPAPGAHGHPAAPVLGPGEHLVSSPMVGTFYAAPAPQEPPYVVEGAEVAVGQSVGIVEAMKMMNPIEAEVAGRVIRILVRDAQGVEYGQPLMVIAES
jgi:acetyl-CoA carboxylase biotin carboxyl carrier protein